MSGAPLPWRFGESSRHPPPAFDPMNQGDRMDAGSFRPFGQRQCHPIVLDDPVVPPVPGLHLPGREATIPRLVIPAVIDAVDSQIIAVPVSQRPIAKRLVAV